MSKRQIWDGSGSGSISKKLSRLRLRLRLRAKCSSGSGTGSQARAQNKVSGRVQLSGPSGAALSAQEGGIPLSQGAILPSGAALHLRGAFYLMRAA